MTLKTTWEQKDQSSIITIHKQNNPLQVDDNENVGNCVKDGEYDDKCVINTAKQCVLELVTYFGHLINWRSGYHS